jgi:hypothetical protein
MITFPAADPAGGKWTLGTETCAAPGATKIAGAKTKANILNFQSRDPPITILSRAPWLIAAELSWPKASALDHLDMFKDGLKMRIATIPQICKSCESLL